MATQLSQAKSKSELVISWEALPKDFKLEDEPVENTGQPLLAGALHESLEISGFIQPQMLIASNFGLCEPDGGLLEYYQLENKRYELKQPDENGRHWIDVMGLFLGTWQGTKEARTGYWLRWWDKAGNLLPWAVEQIEQERQRAEQERQQKERLIAYLQSQGIDPNNLPPFE